MELKPNRLKNDRKAPRFGKAQFIYNVINKELHENWKKENPQYAHYTYGEFLKIWAKITQGIYNELSSNQDGVRLPYYNGDLRISYVHTNKEAPKDTKSSVELQKDIKFLNWNTGGKIGKVCWIINSARKFNKWVKIYGTDIDRRLRAVGYYSFQDHPEIFRVAKVNSANSYMFDKLKKEKDGGQ